eukprot:67607-Amphidinium_carterae.1
MAHTVTKHATETKWHVHCQSSIARPRKESSCVVVGCDLFCSSSNATNNVSNTVSACMPQCAISAMLRDEDEAQICQEQDLGLLGTFWGRRQPARIEQ